MPASLCGGSRWGIRVLGCETGSLGCSGSPLQSTHPSQLGVPYSEVGDAPWQRGAFPEKYPSCNRGACYANW